MLLFLKNKRFMIPRNRIQTRVLIAVIRLTRGESPPVTGGFPSQRPVTRSFAVFFDLHLKKTNKTKNNGLANNGDARDLIHHHTHYDVTVTNTFQNSLWKRCTMKILSMSLISIWNVQMGRNSSEYIEAWTFYKGPFQVNFHWKKVFVFRRTSHWNMSLCAQLVLSQHLGTNYGCSALMYSPRSCMLCSWVYVLYMFSIGTIPFFFLQRLVYFTFIPECS